MAVSVDLPSKSSVGFANYSVEKLFTEKTNAHESGLLSILADQP